MTLNCILLLMKFTCCCLLWMWFQKYGQLQDTQSFNSSHDLLLTKAIEFKSVCTSLNLWKHVTLIAYFRWWNSHAVVCCESLCSGFKNMDTHSGIARPLSICILEPVPYHQFPRPYTITSLARAMWFYNRSYRKQMHDLSCYGIIHVCTQYIRS